MNKTLLLIFLLISVSILEINGTHLTSKSKINRKLEDEIIELSFISAKNLTFNEESRWSLGIEYSGSALNIQKSYLVSILYNGNPALIICDPVDDSKLNCIFGQVGQKQTDLIQLNSDFITGATIKWTNLNKVYDILINATLKYVDSYNLQYHFSGNTIRYWDFKVKISEDSLLPENGKAQIDICSHKEFYLYCSFNKTRPNTYLIQISPTKLSGSIAWENLDANVTIPLYSEISTITKYYDLELINNQWTYMIQLNPGFKVSTESTLITINTQIKNNGQEKIYFTKCNCTSIESAEFQCKVLGENQNLLDLVYLTKSEENEISSKWTISSSVSSMIPRKADLTFKRIYDLEYNTGTKWGFKIDIADDENLPDTAKVKVDVRYDTKNSYATCTSSSSNHILQCNTDSSNIKSTTVFYLQTIKHSEPDFGSVTWNHLRPRYIKIPLNHNYTFVNATFGFFTDKWNFMLFAKDTGATPKNSTVLIDIIQNENDALANCQVIEEGSRNKIIGMFCQSEAANQASTDTLTINTVKKYGSITWNQGTNGLVYTLSMASTDTFKEYTLTYLDAFDMYYANDKWHFTLLANSNANYKEIGIMKVDLSVLRASGTTESAIAKCLLHTGYKESNGVRFLCTCEYDYQAEGDLLKIFHKTGRTPTSTITWQSGKDDPESITLMAKLTITNGHIYKEDKGSHWSFTVNVTSAKTLPLNSKVVVDLNSGSTLYKSPCTVTSQILLTCNSDIASSVSDPVLSYKKTLDSSVTWTNEDEEDYYLIRQGSIIALLSTDYLYFDTEKSKWNFNISVSGLSYSKVIIDAFYGAEATTATCKSGRNHLLHCVVDKDSQEKTTLIKLKKDKVSASVSWSNLNENKDIPLYTELTLDKVDKLYYDNSYNGWAFKINIKDNDIPENAVIIVDLEILRTYGSNGLYTKKYYSIANCIHKSKILTCKVVTSDRTDDKYYEFTPTLLFTKVANSKSTVKKWNDATPEQGVFTLNMNLNLNFASKIFNEEDKYYFYLDIESTSKVAYNTKSIVDIKYGGTSGTSICLALNNTALKCEISGYNPETKYYLSATKSPTSSITWSHLATDQNLFPIKLKYIYAYKFYQEALTIHTFSLIVSGGSDLTNGLRLPVKIKQIVNGQRSGTTYERIVNIPCQNNNEVLSCKWSNPNLRVNPEWDIFKVNLLSSGDIIEWENPSDDIINGTMGCSVYYQGLVFLNYDDTNKYYSFSIRLSRGLNVGDKLVMDLLINSVNRFGFCHVKESRILECQSPYMAKADGDTIFIKYTKNIGIIEWRDKLNADKQIYPNDLIFVEIDKIYDLKFESGRWHFIILPKESITLNEAKKLDIAVDATSDTATCIQDGSALKCSADTNIPSNYQLNFIFF